MYLLPQNLARKRVWNKKYPICIDLGKQDDFMSKAEGDRSEGGEGARGRGEERSSCSSGRELTLYLFGRTGREKEEWFQHFLAASRLKAEAKKAPAGSGTKAGESWRLPSAVCGGATIAAEGSLSLLSWSEAQRSHSRSSSLDETLTSQLRPKDAPASSTSTTTSSSSSTAAAGGGGSARVKPLLDYSFYMATVLPLQAAVDPAAASPVSPSPQSSPGAEKKVASRHFTSCFLFWSLVNQLAAVQRQK